jgi:transcription elongation factor S-II
MDESAYDYVCRTYPNVQECVKRDYVKQIVEHCLSDPLCDFKKIPLGWSVKEYENIIMDEAEHDAYMENPLGNELSESVVACSRCDSSRTFNIEKQTRSLDEPSTIITICYDCKHRQKYSG